MKWISLPLLAALALLANACERHPADETEQALKEDAPQPVSAAPAPASAAAEVPAAETKPAEGKSDAAPKFFDTK